MLAVTAVPNAIPRLTSRQHPLVRTFRDTAADASHSSSVLLDGAHLLREALAARLMVQTVVVGPEFLERTGHEDREVVEAAGARGATVYHATKAVLDAISPVRTSSGVVALAEWSPASMQTAFAPAPALAIGLVDVQDPGNAGAVIRSADALGATGVLALDGTAHPGGWKALRGAMGSTFRLPVARGSRNGALSAARAAGLRILAAVAEGATPIDRVDFNNPTLVLLGNEGAGLAAEIADAADERITIPMRPGVNSLNVAATAALVLYEARRQRHAH